MLIAFEGLDQSGKETQARVLVASLRAQGRRVETLSFPDYQTAIGREIGEALAGHREYGPDVMQLLYIANRFEKKSLILEWQAAGAVVVCDRYVASSIAYGESQGLDAAWLTDAQRYLPQPDLTFVLDIAPEISAARKQTNRDRYERDMPLLTRVRESYRRQAQQPGWHLIDADRAKDLIAREIHDRVDQSGSLGSSRVRPG
jgi:dTMP kinase